MVCFAFIDPMELRDLTFPELPISREMGYTIGFFLFWTATLSLIHISEPTRPY